MLFLEVWKERRVEGRRAEERRVDENGYPPSCLNVFKKKVKERGIISIFIVCNFVNMVKVNLVIYLVLCFYALLSFQISPIWGN